MFDERGYRIAKVLKGGGGGPFVSKTKHMWAPSMYLFGHIGCAYIHFKCVCVRFSL